MTGRRPPPGAVGATRRPRPGRQRGGWNASGVTGEGHTALQEAFLGEKCANKSKGKGGKVYYCSRGPNGEKADATEFFAQFPDVRFYFADRDRGRTCKGNPVIYS
jgi:hypothetical protein